MEVFSEMGVCSKLLPWQHRRILEALFHQDQCELAYRYLALHNPEADTVEDCHLHIDIFNKNK